MPDETKLDISDEFLICSPDEVVDDFIRVEGIRFSEEDNFFD